MLVNGETNICTAKEPRHSQAAIDMKVNGKKISRTVTVLSHGQTAVDMLVNGKTIICTAKEPRH